MTHDEAANLKTFKHYCTCGERCAEFGNVPV